MSLSISDVFSESYYLATNPDVSLAVANGWFSSGLDHFLQYGLIEGRNPSAIFRSSSYLSDNPDVAAAVNNGVIRSGLDHFLQHGAAEGRQPSSRFDNNFYLSQNPDVAAAVSCGLPVPLESDLAHVQGNFLSDGRTVIMASFNPGGRWTPTRVDLAMLADIGYQIVGYQPQGATPAIATEGNDTIFGTIVADIINGLGGNDQIQGSFGNDFLIGGFGNDNLWGGNGRDTFIFEPFSGVDSINDFVVAEDTIQVSAAYGFSSSSQILGTITHSGVHTSGGFFSVLSLSAGNTISIFHDSPLTEVNFTVV